MLRRRFLKQLADNFYDSETLYDRGHVRLWLCQMYFFMAFAIGYVLARPGPMYEMALSSCRHDP